MSDFTGSKAANAAEREKRRPGRPMKEGAVKRTDQRINCWIKRETYDYWHDRNSKSGETMSSLINRLLYEEREKIERNGHG